MKWIPNYVFGIFVDFILVFYFWLFLKESLSLLIEGSIFKIDSTEDLSLGWLASGFYLYFMEFLEVSGVSGQLKCYF